MDNIFHFIFADSPKITKLLVLGSITISFLTWFQILSPLHLYYNSELIFKKFQLWRLISNIFYFGDLNLSLFFHLLLL